MIPDIYELVFCPPVQGQDHYCATTPFIRTCVSLSHLLVGLKSAINWIVYLLAGEKFRRVWCETYLPRNLQPKSIKRARTQFSEYPKHIRTGTTVTLRGKIKH